MPALRVTSIEIVKDGMAWAEGPAHYAGGVVFSDIPNDIMYLWRDGTVSTFRQPSRQTNGNTTDARGRLISCEHLGRAVTRTEDDGSIVALATHWNGRRLNSPNDVAVAPDGGIWFTDPPYMLLRGEAPEDYGQEIDFAGVYRIDPETNAVELMIDVLDKPNGLVFSNDGTALYVSDTGFSHRPHGNHHIFRFEMRAGRPRDLTVFAAIEPGACDGLRIDADGFLWATSGEGVQSLSPEGDVLGRIDLGESGTNLCLLDGRAPRLFVTTPTRALIVTLDTTDAPAGFGRSAT